ALFLMVSAIISTCASLSWRTSLWGAAETRFGLVTIIALSALYFATRAVCQVPGAARRLLQAVPFGAAAAGAYAVIQWIGWDPFAWDGASLVSEKVRPSGPLGHANILAGYLAIAVPITLTRLRECVIDRRWRAGGGYFAILLIEGAAIFAAMSRAGWLAAAAGIFVWFVGQGFARRRTLLIGFGLGILSGVAFAV